MNKKLLNEDNILNELKGGSHFFKERADSPTLTESPKERATDSVLPPASQPSPEVGTAPSLEGNPQIDAPIALARQTAQHPASTLARYPDSLINDLRKIVKSTGKEVSFVRLTPEEKKQLLDIVYIYKSQGVKTSETEINRIAVNYMLEDYKANGQSSLLAQVIAAMLA